MRTIGITTGDPAGIGLEAVLKAIPPLLISNRWVLFTDRSVFQHHIDQLQPSFSFRWIEEVSQATHDPVLFLHDIGNLKPEVAWGRVSREAGERALAYLEAASRAALAGEIAAIVTAPVSKEAIASDFKGQTEYLAGRAASRQFAMAFFAPTFKVVLATIHVSLTDALRQLSVEAYTSLIRFVDRQLGRFRFASRRIAVSGVNPHAGEGGMFGREEIEILRPAVEICRAEGIDVSGPHSADSLYYRAHSGEFDVVIAPYHDQGLIPVKLIAHGHAVNVTLGLPYIRTSPDHGTAFDIAGKGLADPSAMEAAMRCALDLVERLG